MLLELFLFVSAASVTPPEPVQPLVAQTSAESSQSLAEEDLVAALVESLAKLCARHPEVERAFLLGKPAADGTMTYMFVPIFDRQVSDLALSEADRAYRVLFPSRGTLPLTLLARNTWKKQLGGVPPIYVRQRPDKP